ncbi:hypothetical protein E4U42_001921, partial [Claviceps africana]
AEAEYVSIRRARGRGQAARHGLIRGHVRRDVSCDAFHIPQTPYAACSEPVETGAHVERAAMGIFCRGLCRM